MSDTNLSGDFQNSILNIGSTLTNVQQTINVYQHTRPAPVDEATLAKAQQRLAEMPLDEIPAPAPLPPGVRMPLSRNPLFVGREEDLRCLAKALEAGDTAAIGQTAAATGMGGIGKTQLASEFVHRYGQFFVGGVFWLSFADPAGVATEVALCGGRGFLDLAPDFVGLPLEEQVRLVLSAWQSPLPRLLVFDNREDENLLARWRPPSGSCRVLVTSRRQTWSRVLGVQALPLGVLSRAESIELLRKFRPDLPADDPNLNAIAEEMGDLPLALHLAGSYLETYRDDPKFGDPADFLAELASARLLQHPALRGVDVADVSPTNHDLHVARTFALSYGRLLPDDPTGQAALAPAPGRIFCPRRAGPTSAAPGNITPGRARPGRPSPGGARAGPAGEAGVGGAGERGGAAAAPAGGGFCPIRDG